MTVGTLRSSTGTTGLVGTTLGPRPPPGTAQVPSACQWELGQQRPPGSDPLGLRRTRRKLSWEKHTTGKNRQLMRAEWNLQESKNR